MLVPSVASVYYGNIGRLDCHSGRSLLRVADGDHVHVVGHGLERVGDGLALGHRGELRAGEPDDLAAELPPVFLALLRVVGVARAGGRRPAGRLVALSQSVEAESGAIVFRIDLRGALACMAATGPDGTMLMRAACLREGPGTDARPSIH